MNRTTSYSLPLLGMLLAVFLPGAAFADGCMIGPPDSDIWENDQLAFIRYDQDTRTENLHILPKFHGNATEFAWIVPTPTLPTVAVSQRDLFDECANLSAAIRRSRDSAFDCQQSDNMALAPGQNDVEIVSDQLVGIFQTLVLAASDASVLSDSLTAWGYLTAGGNPSVTAALQHYIARDWYFVAMKVDSTALATLDPYGYDYLYYAGGLDPVRFSFASDEIVYPLRISQVSAAPQSRVMLYVATDHKTTFDGATTRYANRISESELAYINHKYPYVGEQLAVGDFLTKLRREFTPSQMTEDIVVGRASNDDEFRRIYYSQVPVTMGLFALGTLLYGAWSARRRFGSRR